jgi:antitoxin CptB|tara:strand:+ start:8 stop:262 length:255 start_codon:yes stop_codon:yes gene_type:complete
MIDKEILKKQIIYRSTHRGTKEMDILLGNFVKKYVDRFNNNDLLDLEQLLFLDDEILYRWYYDKERSEIISNNKVSKMLKNFKL